MKNSDIWDDFLKIVEAKETESNAKDILSKTHRLSGTSVEDIAKLYGTKPKSQTYKNNIIEEAHQGDAIVMDAYDKLNGLVENLNERQAIILRIVNKNSTGQLDTPKYAKDLALSLVKTSNALGKKHPALSALAETCLSDMSISMEKKARMPIVPDLIPATGLAARGFGLLGAGGPWIIGVGALFGVLYAQQHLRFIDRGYQTNHERLLSEIEDLLTSNTNYLVGYEYTQNLKDDMQDLKEMVLKFHDLYEETIPVINAVEKPKTARKLMDVIKNQKGKETSVQQAYDKLKAAIDAMMSFTQRVVTNFKNEDYKRRNIKNKGALSAAVDYTEVLHGGKGMIADSFDDVVRAIAPYNISLKQMLDIFVGAGSLKKRSIEDLQAAESEKSRLGISQHDFTPDQEVTPATVAPQESPSQSMGGLLDAINPFADKTTPGRVQTSKILKELDKGGPRLPPKEDAVLQPSSSRLSRI